MPSAGPRIASCGCVVQPGNRCSHQRQRDRERKARHDQRRPSARQRGYSKAWEQARAEFLAQHPRCTRCGAPATVVNHRTPHKGNRRLFWDRTNWEPACKPCHDGPIQSRERRAEAC